MKIIDINSIDKAKIYDDSGYDSMEYNIDIISQENFDIKKCITAFLNDDNHVFKREYVEQVDVDYRANEIIFSFNLQYFTHIYAAFHNDVFPIMYDDYDDEAFFDEKVMQAFSKMNSFNYIYMSFQYARLHERFECEGFNRASLLQNPENQTYIDWCFGPIYDLILPFLNSSNFVRLADKHGWPEIVLPGFLSECLEEPFRNKILVKAKPYSYSGEMHSGTVLRLSADPRLSGEVLYVDDLEPLGHDLCIDQFQEEDPPKQKIKWGEDDEREISDYIFAGRKRRPLKNL